jgi:S-DNA-T family DNA segregation ATPase FtsK/SpoIIIE
MSRLLHHQADRIELVLASHKVPARVTGGTVTPRLVRYQISTPLGIKIRRIKGLAEEIALSLGAPTCRVYRQAGQVQVEVPRREGQVVHLMEICRKLAASQSQAPPITAVLGLDDGGRPLLLQLTSPNVAHVLLAGTTGSGKTVLARTIISSLALLNPQKRLQMLLIDPKGRGFAPLNRLPHLVRPVLTRADEALPALRQIVDEMERRDREARSDPRLVVVLDELADLIQVGGREMEQLLTRLTQRGREAGIHLVACTQKPSAAVIGSLIKSNFPVRLVGSVTSPEDAKVATGMAGTGAERLLGQGDFLLVIKGHAQRFQGAYLSEHELTSLVTRLVQQGHGPQMLAAWTGTDGAGEQPEGLAARLRSEIRSQLQLVKPRSRRV